MVMRKHTWSDSASVVIKFVIFPDANFLRLSCVNLKDLRNTAAIYNRKWDSFSRPVKAGYKRSLEG